MLWNGLEAYSKEQQINRIIQQAATACMEFVLRSIDQNPSRDKNRYSSGPSIAPVRASREHPHCTGHHSTPHTGTAGRSYLCQAIPQALQRATGTTQPLNRHYRGTSTTVYGIHVGRPRIQARQEPGHTRILDDTPVFMLGTSEKLGDTTKLGTPAAGGGGGR